MCDGLGSISEVVAQYVMRMRLSPQSLYKNYPADNTDGESQPEVELEKEEDTTKESLSPLERIQGIYLFCGAYIKLLEFVLVINI